MDDRDVVERTLEGNVDAFEVLVNRYRGRVYAAALARVYDAQDALDVVQESFIRAFLKLATLRDRDKFAPWLFAISRRISTDLLRGRWCVEEGELAMKRDSGNHMNAEDPRSGIAARDTAKTLWGLVGQLNEDSREVLSLHYGQQMTVSEISEMTGVRESAVKMRLKKARSVLSDRVGSLQGLWGAATLPQAETGIMAAIKAAGSAKAGMAPASVFAAPALGWLAFLGAFGWASGLDIRRWRDHAPRSMARQAKGINLKSIAWCLGATAFGLFISPYLTRIGAPAQVSYFIVFGVLLTWIFWREIALVSPKEKAKQMVNVLLLVSFFAVMFMNPDKHIFLAVVGCYFAMQFFLINTAQVMQAAVRPGFWVTPMLRRTGDEEPRCVPVEQKRIRPWLTMLHELGLVAPPCKTETNAVTVRLRLRQSTFEKMAFSGYSTLRADTSGAVTCTITPSDYVALAQHFDEEAIPGRRELGATLSRVFKQAFGVYAEGGDSRTVMECLGLTACPMDIRKTRIMFMNKYVLPLGGVLLLVASLIGYFM